MKTLRLLVEIKQSSKTLFSAIITLISPLITALAILFKYSWKLTRLVIIVGIVTLIVAMCTSRSVHQNISPQYKVYKYEVLDRYRVRDEYNDKWTTGWLSEIDRNFGSDSLIRISKKNIFGNNERYGYLDVRTGTVAIETKYRNAGIFSEGLAAVSGDDGRGFIDGDGKFVASFSTRFDNINDMILENGHTVAQAHHLAENNGVGVINAKGEWVLKPLYDEITSSTQGCYIVGEMGAQGLWSIEKGWIMEPTCYSVEPYNYDEGFRVSNWDTIYIIDAQGNVINPFVFTYSEPLTYPTSGDDSEARRISDYVLFALEDQCYGIYNIRTNEIILPAEYSNIYMASKDVFVVEDSTATEYFVDNNGNVISPKNVK